MLKQRIISAIILIAVIFIALFLFTPFYFALCVGGITTIGIWEWSQFAKQRFPLMRFTITAFSACLLFLYLYVNKDLIDAGRLGNGYQIVLLASIIWWCIALIFVITFPRSVKVWSDSAILVLIFGFFTLIPFFLGVISLRTVNYNASPLMGVYTLLYVFILVWCADSGAYFAGRKFGKHKLLPKVSPGKTWEGVLGGLILAAVVASVFLSFFPIHEYTSNHSLTYVVILTVATVAVSVLGDLVESMFKRQAGVKDSSHIIPGHGGVLDRIDSLTAAIPFFTYFYFFVG